MAPVNVTTHHKCINGESCNILYDSELISIDINYISIKHRCHVFLYQLDIKYQGYTDSPVTTFLVRSNTRLAMK